MCSVSPSIELLAPIPPLLSPSCASYTQAAWYVTAQVLPVTLV